MAKKYRAKIPILGPDGRKYYVYCRKRRLFAEKHDINPHSLKRLLDGNCPCIKGWISLTHKDWKETVRKSKIYLINTRTNEIIKKPQKETELCDKIGLNRDCLNKLIRGVYLSAKGWMLLERYELIYGKLDKNELCDGGIHQDCDVIRPDSERGE